MDKPVNVALRPLHEGVVDVGPTNIEINPNTTVDISGTITGRSPGHVEIIASAEPKNTIE